MRDYQDYQDSREFGDPFMDEFWIGKSRKRLSEDTIADLRDYQDPFGAIKESLKTRENFIGDMSQLSMTLSYPILHTRIFLNGIKEFFQGLKLGYERFHYRERENL
ncbi:MAG: hypothetical protein ACOCUU_03440 [Nanoarchaeota archaeon]